MAEGVRSRQVSARHEAIMALLEIIETAHRILSTLTDGGVPLPAELDGGADLAALAQQVVIAQGAARRLLTAMLLEPAGGPPQNP